MNQLINRINEFYEQYVVTDSMEEELLLHILDNSQYTSLADFTSSNISQDDAEAIALSNKYLIPDYLASNGIDFDLIIEAIKDKPEVFAHYLAFHNSELGKQLLDELLFYRSKGRV
jgi:hypothetical protein